MSGGWRRHGLSVYRTTIGGGDVLEVAQADGSKDKERLLALAEAVHAALTGPAPAAPAAMADALRSCVGALEALCRRSTSGIEHDSKVVAAECAIAAARAALAEQPQEPAREPSERALWEARRARAVLGTTTAAQPQEPAREPHGECPLWPRGDER